MTMAGRFAPLGKRTVTLVPAVHAHDRAGRGSTDAIEELDAIGMNDDFSFDAIERVGKPVGVNFPQVEIDVSVDPNGSTSLTPLDGDDALSLADGVHFANRFCGGLDRIERPTKIVVDGYLCAGDHQFHFRRGRTVGKRTHEPS